MICCNAAWPEATQQTKEEAETAFNWEVRHFFLIYLFLKVQILDQLSFWKNIIHSGLCDKPDFSVYLAISCYMLFT